VATGLTAAVQAQYGRVLLQLTWTNVASASIVRVHADGTTWPVRWASPAQVTATSGVGWIGYDHEAPLDQAVTYRATSTTDAAIVTSNAVTVAADTGFLGSTIWLTHPLKPALSRLVAVENIAAHGRESRGSTLRIVGRADPVAQTDTRLSPTGEITAITTTFAETNALVALLADGAVLLARCPAAWGAMWFYALIGATTDEGMGSATEQWREWKLPYTVVARLAGDGTGAVGVTYATVAATYATYTALQSLNSAPLNSNPYFETTAAGWTPTGATFVRSTAQAHEGVASGLFTPNGVATTPQLESGQVTAVAGRQYQAAAWVRCAAARNIEVFLSYLQPGGAFISASGTSYAVAANTWTRITHDAPAPAGTGLTLMTIFEPSTPPGSATLYVDEAQVIELFTYNSILTGP
jgi:hypothetical protein